MLMLRVLNWYNLPIPAMIGYILVTPPKEAHLWVFRS